MIDKTVNNKMNINAKKLGDDNFFENDLKIKWKAVLQLIQFIMNQPETSVFGNLAEPL